MDWVLVKTIHLAKQIAQEKLKQNGIQVTKEDMGFKKKWSLFPILR